MRRILAMTLILLVSLSSTAAAADLRWEWRNPIPTGADLHGVAYGAGLFVAVGTGGTLLTSPDGHTWRLREVGTTLSLYDVAFADGRFVVVGGRATRQQMILTSRDGLTWTPTYEGAGPRLTSVTFGGGRFVASGACAENNPEGPAGVLLTSDDGEHWVDASPSGLLPLCRVKYDAGQFVAGSYEHYDYTSTDGTAWTRTPTDPTQLPWWRFFAAGDRRFDGHLASASDGADWTNPVFENAGPYWVTDAVASSGNAYVAVGPAGFLAVSGDGARWHLVTKAAGLNYSGPSAYGSGHYVTAGRSEVLVSDNGVTWTHQELEIPGFNGTYAPSFVGIAFGNDKFVMVGAGPSNSTLTSADGQTWSHASHRDWPFSVWTVAFGNGRFVVGGLDGAAVSTDGEHWEISDLTGMSVLQVAYGNGRFVAAGRTKGDAGRLYASADGLEWQQVQASDIPLTGVAFAKGRFLATGSQWVVDHLEHRLLTSTDGLTWQDQEPLPATNIRAGGGRFFAWSPDQDGTTVYTSEDGSTWSAFDLPLSVTDIALVGDRFLAAGPRGTVMMTRPEGSAADQAEIAALLEEAGITPPGGPLTRESLLVAVARAAGVAQDELVLYRDLDPAAASSPWIGGALSAGLVGAYAPTPLWAQLDLLPDEPVTAAEVATLLRNMAERSGRLSPW